LVKDDSNNEGSSREHGDMDESNKVGNASITFNRISIYNLASVASMDVLVCFH
jgi:Pyruvate/2-oxoacid:ferredoxin oxidoreductase gamma subunit